MNSKDMQSYGFIALEVSLVAGAMVTTGWLPYLLFGAYFLLPAMASVALLYLIYFLHDPSKVVFRKMKNGNVNVNLNPFYLSDDMFSQITSNDKTKPIYWYVDAAIFALGMIGMYLGINEGLAMLVLLLLTSETILREHFITMVVDKRDIINLFFTTLVKELEKIERDSPNE